MIIENVNSFSHWIVLCGLRFFHTYLNLDSFDEVHNKIYYNQTFGIFILITEYCKNLHQYLKTYQKRYFWVCIQYFKLFINVTLLTIEKKDFRNKDFVYIYLGRSCAEVVDAGPGAERLLEPDGPADAVHQFVLA